MSHHYGEDAVSAVITGDRFVIVLTNHHTRAEITVTGPIDGLYEKMGRKLTQNDANNLGGEIAHLLRDVLGG